MNKKTKRKIIMKCIKQLIIGFVVLVTFIFFVADAAMAHPPKKMDKGSYYKLTQLIKKNE